MSSPRVRTLWSGSVWIVAATAGMLLASQPIQAVVPPDQDPLPDIDLRVANAVPSASQNQAVAELQQKNPEVLVWFDPLLAAPAQVTSRDALLPTAPAGGGAQNLSPLDLVGQFLEEHRSLFGTGRELLATVHLQREYRTAHNGLRTVIWQQELDGVPVWGGRLVSTLSDNNRLVSLSSLCLPRLPATGGGPVQPQLEAAAAVRRAVAPPSDNSTHEPTEEQPHPGWQTFSSPDLNGLAYARLVWLPTSAQTLRLCWEIILTPSPRTEMYRVIVDAETGQVWVRHCLTEFASPATFRVFTSDSPRARSPGLAIPVTNEPPVLARSLVTVTALDTNASPEGWINEADNVTRGNNVSAQLDRDNNDQPDLPLPEGTPERVFDFGLDLSASPASYGRASVVQLFYWNNWIHDRLYGLGFTEAAGNFQLNNFGRGGLGGDPVLADAQNGGATDNANFSTPPDGLPPRMQMFLWNGAQPARDAALDAEVILHEYVHGLTHRLVGGGGGMNTLQAQGLGEGWSDFYALALLSEEGDEVDGNYALGAYIAHRAGSKNYYFGLRRYPYSTNPMKNPLTFRDIDPAQAGVYAGIPRNPVASSEATQVHNIGEVWCVALWEARARLIHKFGFATGNELILQLVTDGLRLTPANPTFIQARDAVLIADRVLTGGQNENELWAAFAERGLGFSARAPASHTTVGVSEAFDLADSLHIDPLDPQQFAGPLGGPFAPDQFIYRLNNSSPTPISFTAGTDAPWLAVLIERGLLGLTNVTVRLTGAARLLPEGVHYAKVAFTNLATGRIQYREVSLHIGQTPFYTELFDFHANDLAYQSWTFLPNGSAQSYSVCRTPIEQFPVDPNGGSSVILPDEGLTDLILSDQREVVFFGRRYNSVTASSNGYLTFGEIEQARTESIEAHFRRIRLSALFDDLNPNGGGRISWQQLPDRVVITYFNIPEAFSANTNSFQIELFFDGAIRLSYLQIDALDGLVGLSPGGGVPPDFAQTDYSSLPECERLLSLRLPETVAESAGQTGAITIYQPASSNVVVALSSDQPDQLTVPASVVIPAGQTTVSFTLQPVNDLLFDGPQRVVVRAHAIDYLDAVASLMVLDDDRADLQIQVPSYGTEGQSNLVGLIQLSQPAADYLLIWTRAEPAEAIRLPPFLLIEPGVRLTTFNFDLIDNNRIEPTQSIVVMAEVTGGPSDLDITLVEDNESRQLRLVLPANGREGSGTLAGVCQIQGVLATNLTLSLASDRPGTLQTPVTVTIPAGQSQATFPITLPENNQLEGNLDVMVQASAPGFLTGTFTVSVSDNEIPLEPTLPSPANLATDVPADVTLSWALFDVGQTQPTVFDVYFSTTPSLNPADLVLTTNATRWAPGLLQPLTTYYWQIVARRKASTPGPVWRFTTRGIDHFTFDPIPSPQQPGKSFPVTLTARDQFGTRVNQFEGAVVLAATGPSPETLPRLLISEVEAGDPDYAEFLNVTSMPINLAGWQIILYDQTSWPEPLVEFALPAVFCPPGAAFRLGDLGQPPGGFPTFSPSQNIRWLLEPTNNPIAVLLRDGEGQIADFFCAGTADPTAIANPVVIPWAQWRGSPIPANLDPDINYQRRGMADSNFGKDWVLGTGNAGIANPGLPLPFTDMQNIAVSPTNLILVNGQWTGQITIWEPAATRLVASALDQRSTSSVFAVTLQNDLSVSMTSSPDPVAVGGEVDLHIVVSNSGPVTATNVILIDTLPASVFVTRVDAPQAPIQEGSSVVFELGTLAPFQSQTIHLFAQPQVAGTITNRALVRLGEPDGYAANNLAVGVVSVRWPLLSIDDFTVKEGNVGTGIVKVPVRLALPTKRTVEVDVIATDGTASARDDYQVLTRKLIFEPGQTNASVAVVISGDEIFETNETLSLALKDPVNAQLARNRATLTITNDEPNPVLTVQGTTLLEGRAGFSSAIFTIQLTPAHSQTVSVQYTTEASSATAEEDYLSVAGLLQFPPGTTSASVAVPVSGDRLTEPNESFHLLLSGASRATIANARAQAVIVNDDGFAGQVDHLRWEIDAPPSYVNFPFQVVLRALDAFEQPVPGFEDPVQLWAVLEAHRPVRVLSFAGYSTVGPGSAYDSTMAAIRAYFPDFTNTAITQTDPETLNSALQTNEVFLVPAQDMAAIGTLGPLGESWQGALFQFVQRGGIVIVCSGAKDEHVLLARARLLQSDKFGSSQSTLADGPNPHPLLEGVELPFQPPSLGRYVNHNGTVLIEHNRFAAVLFRATGPGLTLLVGADFRNRRPSLDRLLANAVQLPQAAHRELLPVSPPRAGAFSNGRWMGSITVPTPGQGLRLLATNDSGLFELSEPLNFTLRDDLSVRILASTDPTARNSPFTCTIVVSNSGPETASAVLLSNALPHNVSPLGWSSSQGSCALKGSSIQCALGSIPPLSHATVTVQLLPTQLNWVTNVVTVRMQEPDSYLPNNTAQQTLRVEEVGWAIESISVPEGNSAITIARFPVRLFPPVEQPVQVRYQTCDLDASSPSDFLATNGLLRFAPGQILQFAEVQIRGDERTEAHETFCVRLSDPSLGALVMGDAIATIVDDDSLGPRLTVRLEGNEVILSWPADNALMLLQKAERFSQAIEWHTVLTAPQLENAMYHLSLPLTGGTTYFRLVNPMPSAPPPEVKP